MELLIFSEFFDAKMRADTRDAGRKSFAVRPGIWQTGKPERVAAGEQLNRLKPGGGEFFYGAGKVFRNHLPNGPRLTSDGEAKWIGVKFERSGGKKSGGDSVRCGGLDELVSRLSALISPHFRNAALGSNHSVVPGGRTSGPHRNLRQVRTIPIQLLSHASGEISEE